MIWGSSWGRGFRSRRLGGAGGEPEGPGDRRRGRWELKYINSPALKRVEPKRWGPDTKMKRLSDLPFSFKCLMISTHLGLPI